MLRTAGELAADENEMINLKYMQPLERFGDTSAHTAWMTEYVTDESREKKYTRIINVVNVPHNVKSFVFKNQTMGDQDRINQTSS